MIITILLQHVDRSKQKVFRRIGLAGLFIKSSHSGESCSVLGWMKAVAIENRKGLLVRADSGVGVSGLLIRVGEVGHHNTLLNGGQLVICKERVCGLNQLCRLTL